MAIKKLSELPRGKRATVRQVEKARKAKPITTKHKIIGSKHGRLEINLGTHDKDDVAGVIKGFRRKHKADFGAIIKDEQGNVIARTHTASGKTTIPEQLAVKALSKYAKGYDRIKIVLSAPVPKRKRSTKKGKRK
jgi:replicative superfamily II helicase